MKRVVALLVVLAFSTTAAVLPTQAGALRFAGKQASRVGRPAAKGAVKGGKAFGKAVAKLLW
jgi:hypothetical protein